MSDPNGIPSGYKEADPRTIAEYDTLQTHANVVAELTQRIESFKLSIEHSKELGAKLQKSLTEKGLSRHAPTGKLIMKALGLLLACFLGLGLGGCALGEAAKKTAEGQQADTSTPAGAIGSTLVTVGLLAAGILLPGIPVAGIVKSLVTALDSSVPAASHDQAIQQLGQSVPAALHDALINSHNAAVAALGNSVPASSVVPILAAQVPPKA